MDHYYSTVRGVPCAALGHSDHIMVHLKLCKSFCEDIRSIPSCTRVSYNNDKLWFTAKLRQLRLRKEEVFRSWDRDRCQEAKYRFSKAVRDAKRLYSEKLQEQFSANDSASVWKGLNNCKPKAPPLRLTLCLAN